jgi:predicted TIM-barrel fold metal-dependent hydrolase
MQQLDEPDVAIHSRAAIGFFVRAQHPAQAARQSIAEDRRCRAEWRIRLWRRGYDLLRRFGLRFDLQTPWWHLHEAARLARAYPDTQIILNHTGLPADRSRRGSRAGKRAMSLLAQCPNVAVKISGIGVPGRAGPQTPTATSC